MHFGWPSPSLPKLTKHENSTITISGDEGSTLAAIITIGTIIGSLTVGTTIDLLGRKRFILLTSVPFAISWLMLAFGDSIVCLYIARAVAGLGDGWSYTSVPMYIGEISEPKIRGLLGCCVQVSWVFGILLINILGSYLSIMTTALLSSIVPIIALLIFMFMPESPYYLLMKNRLDEARESLMKFRGTNNIDHELTRIDNAIKAQIENTGKFLDLFTNRINRKTVLIIMGLRGAQQFTGTIAITFYSQTIFDEADIDISPESASILYFSVQFLLSFIGSTVVDRIGRRPLLVLSITGSAVALFFEGTYFYLKTQTNIETDSVSIVPIIALIGFVVMFSLGMQTIPTLMMSELFPTNVKAFGLCFGDIYFCIMATIVAKLFQFLKDSLGMFVPFYVFTISCIIGLMIIILFVPETKGKTLEQIQLELGGKIETQSGDLELNNIVYCTKL